MMSPDTVSSLFPDRPIRPLPKRRLRERLSPETAGSIKYPLSTQENTPLFHYPPYTVKEDGQNTTVSPDSILRAHFDSSSRLALSQQRGAQPGTDGDSHVGTRSTLVTRSPPEILNRTGREVVRREQPRQVEPLPPPSATSSVDGYDSFENTNNKKKRKIPSAGESSINGSHVLGNEINGLGVSVTASPQIDDVHASERSYHGSSSYQTPLSYATTNQGFSGPGRGRLGRSGNGRSPLRALPDGNSAWPSRGAKAGTTNWPAANDTGGIISSAIANAERLPPQEQENVSLLEQHSSTPKTTPAASQFTFTCESQVPGTVQWPGNSSRDGMATQAPSMQANASTNSSINHDMSQTATSHAPSQSATRAQRLEDRELKRAARYRQRKAAQRYRDNPPKAEDFWLCEICEYERIFGQPPRHFIREYELKALEKRRSKAARKEHLAQAKARSRKSKKASKGLNRGEASGSHHTEQSSSDNIENHGAPATPQAQSHSTDPAAGHDAGVEEAGGLLQFGPLHDEGDAGGTNRQGQAKS